MSDFAGLVISWQRAHGRHDLPWQNTRDPYRIWLSEIMLQQTQVVTVIPYYRRFVGRFPDLATLAAAEEEEVLGLWSGLGYYARGRNLLRAARQLRDGGGVFPREPEAIARLPGIGRSTAAAIAVFAFGVHAAILDGNVKRVLTRVFGVAGAPADKRVENRLWQLAESLLPARDVEAYTQGLMDLGATVCTRTRPRCACCPAAACCVASRTGTTATLPGARTGKRVRPRRHAVMLVLLHEGRILLERRPPVGIWGGLLSLPELPDGQSAEPHVLQRFGCTVSSVVALPRLRHGFTHFELEIQPLLCKTDRIVPALADNGRVWLAPGDTARAALPAPVRRLLLSVGSEG